MSGFSDVQPRWRMVTKSSSDFAGAALPLVFVESVEEDEQTRSDKVC